MANRFKTRIRSGERMFGCWAALCSPYAAELVGHCGFDWVLVDGEHAPNDLQSLVAQLQALAGTPCDTLVRLPMGEDWLIKQALDAGAQTLLIPMVHSAADARRLVRATRYPPQGLRGVGHALGRVSRFGLDTDYGARANDEVCLLVQVESRAGMEALDDILATDGVDGVFIGPADLAADLGACPTSDDFRSVLADLLGRIAASGKSAGIISLDDGEIQSHLDAGAQIVAIAIDVLTLSRTLSARAAFWKSRAQDTGG